MSNSRRNFLKKSSLRLMAVAALPLGAAEPAQHAQQPATPGAPPAFGTSPGVGPEIPPGIIADAEKLVQFPLTPADRAFAATTWRSNMSALYELRTGPRHVPLEPTAAP